MKKRPMPEDFDLHAYEHFPVLEKRYHAGQSTIARWRAEMGIVSRPHRPVEQISLSGHVIAVYDSPYYAGEAIGKTHRNIWEAAKNYPFRTSYGYRWRFVDGKL